MMQDSKKYILVFSEISIKDVPLVGGKNASLGEMFGQLTQKGVNVPDGFALTSDAYWYYLEANKIDSKLRDLYSKLKAKNLTNLNKTSDKARKLILEASFPKDLEEEILSHYRKLSEKYGEKDLVVAARSSATAEDSATASFAGQHETYLNVSGEKELLITIKKCISSLFLARAISYREEKGFDHMKIALSVGIQKMIKSDLGSSGIIFTLDTETGFRNVVLINSIWGVGEMIVKGKITPDQFYVFKPTLKEGYKSIIVKNLGRKDKKYIFNKTGLKEVVVSQKDQLVFSINEQDILQLAKWACIIEDHYQRPQDIEWAKDGKTGELFVVQSRPETVHAVKNEQVYEEYIIGATKKPLVIGSAVGNKIGQGKARIISDISKSKDFKSGEVLVATMTDPDWMPLMRIASAIVTDEGGKTCHAAIVSRELGIPCIVGTKNATQVLKNGQVITADCTQGLEGRVYEGKIVYELKSYNLEELPKTKTKLMVNVGVPDTAFKTSFLPNDGVGLAREEFIIAEKIKVHPLALYHYDKIKNQKLNRNKFVLKDSKDTNQKSKIREIIKKIDEVTIEHKDKREYFIKELAEGIAQIAAAFYPKKVIVRFSDFKSNEYKNLIGGEFFEKEEQNPMIGFRGASRYLDKEFQPAFKMECEAIKRAREVFGLKNICVMIPFCRTVEEGKAVVDLIKEFGLEQGKPARNASPARNAVSTAGWHSDAGGDGLDIYVMCEIPSNVILAEKFLEVFDGMSIGSNDLTQLILGLDRDSAQVAHVGDERNEAVKEMIKKVIAICKEKGKYVGICGEAPSTYPEFAEFLVKEGIESMSLNPDSIIKTTLKTAEVERRIEQK